MANSNAWLAPIVIALITALGTYLAVVRKTSGRIGTTEASKLWDEATSLRAVYQGEIARLRAEVNQVEEEVQACQQVIDEQREELRHLRRRNDELERQITRLQRELDNHASV